MLIEGYFPLVNNIIDGVKCMEEKRRHKRLDIDVSVQLERLDEDGVTTLKYCHVDVTDISRSGIGFNARVPLDIHTYYDTKIQIWTKEVVDAVIEIVRRTDGDRKSVV